ncbi:transcriptional regulator, TetR family [Rhizobiales bacterium GAS188]|nr:transcriptional regulator, TetR family [Rhizobiales bacterium GAS188]
MEAKPGMEAKLGVAAKAGMEEVARPRPRDRIVVTARDLFHKHGIRGIGVDAIVEAAGTNKMTLYRHFGSKDDLIVACLHKVAGEADAIWDLLDEKYQTDKLGELHAWVRLAADCVVADGRGCDMANAAIELTESDHPARRVIEEFKTAQRNRLANLCRAAEVTHPDLLADALSLLFEGARVSRQSVGAEGPSARFVRMAEAIIASFGKQPAEQKT